MSLADFQHWAGTLSTADKLTLIATIATLVAVLVAIWQLRESNKTARGQFWLMLRSVLTQYDDIHAISGLGESGTPRRRSLIE